MTDDLNRKILEGDIFEKIKEIPDESIDVMITSPPYWGMRDYGVKGQLGLEYDFRDYLDKMQLVMNEVRRVLKSTGTAWVNMGDPYAGSGKGAGGNSLNTKESFLFGKKPSIGDPLPAKCRYGMPERFYIDCIDNGWIARNHCAWVKGNAMPESVKDRFRINWESVFFFAKEPNYFFDLDPVREKPKEYTPPYNVRVRDAKAKISQQKLSGGMSEKEDQEYDKRGVKHKNLKSGRPDGAVNTMHRKRAERKCDSQTISRNHSGAYDMVTGEPINNPKGRNPGAVFYINTLPFPEAHFATFPPALPERIIKCAAPPKGMVLDIFFGAGTTALAAERLGRQWCGIELNPEYAEIARKRLNKYRNERLT